MATVAFGGGVSLIVGRVGGSVFQRGRAGAQLKALPINTGRKQNMKNFQRARLAGLSTNWRALSQLKRDEWDALALTQTRYNRIGSPYTPSGFQVYCELNTGYNLMNSTAFIGTAPAPVTLPTYTGTTVAIDATGTTYTISGAIANGSVDWQWLIEVTGPQAVGIGTNRQPFKIISKGDDLSADPSNQWSNYTKRFGFLLREGQVVFTRISAIEINTGWRMPSQVIRSVVTV